MIFQANKSKGFTLLEIGFVLIIMGLILFMASGSWTLLMEGRKISSAQNILEISNNCLKNYVSLSKKVPTKSFFLKNCLNTDPWGQSISFFSSAEGKKILCNKPLKVIRSLIDKNGEKKTRIVWLLVSSGPDRKLNFSPLSTTWNLSKGDDLYVFITDMELHEQVCF